MAKLDMSYYEYFRFKKFKPLVKWEDIQIGETYHIPPIVLYDRRDFICQQKDTEAVSGQIYDYQEKAWKRGKFYRHELSLNYFVKRRPIKVDAKNT